MGEVNPEPREPLQLGGEQCLSADFLHLRDQIPLVAAGSQSHDLCDRHISARTTSARQSARQTAVLVVVAVWVLVCGTVCGAVGGMVK